MATSFPTSLDSLTNPIASNPLNSPSHAGQHADANDAIEALEAKVGVNGSAVTTSLDYKSRFPELAGGNAFPFVTSGAYFDGSGLVLSGQIDNCAFLTDMNAIKITGDIDIKVKLSMQDWTPSEEKYVIGKWQSTFARSYLLSVKTDGTISFSWTTGGSTILSEVSTTATGFADGATKWIRATLDVNDGAGNRVTKFYTSDNGSTWTQLGTTVTTAGTTSIYNSTSNLTFGTEHSVTTNLVTGTIYRAIIQSQFDTSDNTSNLRLDADFSTATANGYVLDAITETGIKSDGLVIRGRGLDYASTPDSAAVSTTGDIDIKVKATLPDWTPASGMTLCAKWGGSGNRSWYFSVESTGVLQFVHTADGSTNRTAASTVATGITDNTAKWVRATMDANNGASGRDVKFYTSDDGSTWTQLGTTVTTAGTSSIFDSTAVLEVGQLSQASNSLNGTVHRTILQSEYDTANNTASLQFDADFESQDPETKSFVESSGNAAVVSVFTYPFVFLQTTRYHLGIPNAPLATITTGTVSANSDRYAPFLVTKTITVDMFALEVTTAPSARSTVYHAIYEADTNMQPINAPLATASYNILPGSLGSFRAQITPVVLKPGCYLLATNASTSFSARIFGSGGMCRDILGSFPYVSNFNNPRTAATFPSSPSAYNRKGSGTTGLAHVTLLRWGVS